MSDYEYCGDEADIYGDDYEPELSPQNSSGVPSKIRIEEMTGVETQLSDAIIEVNDLVALNEDWSLLLFKYFKWNYEKLQANYFNDQSRKQALKQIHYLPNSQVTIENKPTLCEVCLAESPSTLKNYCGHAFCLDCWKEHIAFNISNKVVFIRCMHEGCEYLLLNSTINKLLETSPSNKQKYKKGLCEKYVEMNHNIKFCPGADCKFCIYSENPLLNTVKCKCGEVFCFRCRNEVHRPCSCADVSAWKEIVVKEEANINWIIQNTKVCPFCKKFVERSMGCNYMHCAPPGGCGGAFCYVCSKSWLPDHANHFVCNVFKESSAPEVGKEQLVRIQFYSEKYMTNDQCKKKIKEKSQNLLDHQTSLFNILSIPLNQSQFILEAFRFAGQACDALKWSYAYGFVTSSQMSAKQKQDFEFYQGDFERWKENLIIRLEQKFNLFVQELIENQEENVAIDAEKKKQEFEEIKTEILNYYKTAESEMVKLLKLIETEF